MTRIAGRTFWVTGATGCLGAEVTHRLEELGAHPIPLVLSGYPSQPKRSVWRAETRPFLVAKAADLDDLPPPRSVINLHWLVDRTLDDDRQQAYELHRNVTDLEFLWNRVHDAGSTHFLNVSSISVFSHLNQSPITAHTEPRPITPYGKAKLAAEHYFETRFAQSSVQLAHIRLGPVSAPCEHPSRLMSGLYASAFHGTRVRINLGHTSCGLFLDEAADLLIQAAVTAVPGRYLLTGPPVANEETTRVFEEVAGLPLNADFVDLAPDTTDPVFVSDTAQFSTEWTRRVDVPEAVRRIIAERARHEAAPEGEAGRDPSHLS